MQQQSLNLLRILLLLFALGIAQKGITQCNPNQPELPGNGIDEDCDGLDDLFFSLPPYIYLVEGQPFQLYYHNTILSKHAFDYVFEVITPLAGVHTQEKWIFTPDSQNIGTFPLTVKIKTQAGVLLASKSTQVRISSSAAPVDMSPKNMLLLGHSFLDQGYLPYYLYQMTHTVSNPPIQFVGKKNSWANPLANHEGHGGKSWRWFATDSISPIRYQDKINFNTYFADVIGPDKKPDWAVIYLDINDFMGYSTLYGNTLQEIDDSINLVWNQYANPVIDSLRAAAPNCKIGICLAPPAHGYQSAFDSLQSYLPLLTDRWRWQKIVSRVHIKNVEKYSNREGEHIFLIPTQLNFDDSLDYPAADPFHPTPGDLLPGYPHRGYNLVAESIFGWIKWAQHNQGQLITFFRDFDQDGFGDPTQTALALVAPAGYVGNASDCNDQNPNIKPGATEICNNLIDENCNGLIDEDLFAPQAFCKSNLTISLNDSGEAWINPLDLNEGSMDNCGVDSMYCTPAQISCAQIGSNEVILTVIDAAGNTDACISQVMVMDQTPPLINCGNLYLNIPAEGILTISASDAIVFAYDNCQLDTSTIQPKSFSFTCIDADSIFQMVISMKDVYQNQGYCTANIHIYDQEDADQDGVSNCADACPFDGGTTTGYAYYLDLDLDGVGAGGQLLACNPPTNAVFTNTDCDDANPLIYPGAMEILDNAIDEDCNGVADTTSQTQSAYFQSLLRVFPNPATYHLTIQSESTTLQQISMYSYTGALILDLPIVNERRQTIDVATFAEGAYFIKIRLTDGKTAFMPWIKAANE